MRSIAVSVYEPQLLRSRDRKRLACLSFNQEAEWPERNRPTSGRLCLS
ncbi:hypothetical protein REJC140_03425 [Pseudorhizobium endolithicum]|uniref:Uncharacterized protein n=1 Tax=Pseudorhizobium endolithicum TaxID=1191678 RepID=A0ABN7JQ68_9HYPH|nr:hypothetical protein REJC140_03425 [Pseudorhizobium endolithicum]